MLQCLFAAIARPDAQHIIDWNYKDLAVAKLIRLRRRLDCFDHIGELVVTNQYFQLDLRAVEHLVLATAVVLGLTFLPAVLNLLERRGISVIGKKDKSGTNSKLADG